MRSLGISSRLIVCAKRNEMGNAFRNQPMRTSYGENRTPVTEDVLQVGILFAFGLIGFSFLLIIPGIRGWERLWAIIRVYCALWIGVILLVCNFGSWYAGSICTRTQYKAYVAPVNSPQIIQATVGLSIGLRGTNVTLKETEDGCPNSPEGGYERPFPGEMIDYNENFLWAPWWFQGRLDYSAFGGQFRHEYRASQYRGLPYPILWVAENFLIDGGQIRWYRKFRSAGWFTHIYMWLAFALYLITMLLLIFSIHYGGLFMALTGSIMLLACLSYGVVIQNDPPLQIHFPDAVLRPSFNYAFYLTLVTGILTVFGGIVIVLMDWVYPRTIAAFFHMGMIEDDAVFEGVTEEEQRETQELGQQEAAPVQLRNRNNRGSSKKGFRRSTFKHFRESIRSDKSASGNRRSDVFPRPVSLSMVPVSLEKQEAVESEAGTAQTAEDVEEGEKVVVAEIEGGEEEAKAKEEEGVIANKEEKDDNESEQRVGIMAAEVKETGKKDEAEFEMVPVTKDEL